MLNSEVQGMQLCWRKSKTASDTFGRPAEVCRYACSRVLGLDVRLTFSSLPDAGRRTSDVDTDFMSIVCPTMLQDPTREGKIAFQIPSVQTDCFTYYKVYGDLGVGATPLVVLHGGPGAGHEYLLPFVELWPRYNVPVILYDQIGCASSTHLRETAGDKTFWKVSLFTAELDNLLDHLEVRSNGFYLLGQSWGGCLAATYAAGRPQGLRKLILASATASTELTIQGTMLLRNEMPPEMQQAINEAEDKGNYDDPGYQNALEFFYKKHLYRADPFPPDELLPTLKNMTDDKTVYSTMSGPSSLTINGSLLNWTVIPRLAEISVPTFVYNGEYDTSHDIATVPFFDRIPRVRWTTYPNGGHMCHLEGELGGKILRDVGQFLTQDAPSEEA